MTLPAYSLPDHFVLTAHRGAVDVAPENTLSAFRAAEDLGMQEAELDIQITRDGHLVVVHDPTLARLTLAPGTPQHPPVVDLDLVELRSMDLGLGERVPLFEEVLEATTLGLQVEIKQPRAARALARLLAGRPAADRARCVVTSFSPISLLDFQDEAQGAGLRLERGTGLLVADVTTDWPHIVERLGVRSLYLHWPNLTREIVADYQERGFTVCASMFNSTGELRRIIETGVDGSSTDRPRFAMDLLAGLRDQGSTTTP